MSYPERVNGRWGRATTFGPESITRVEVPGPQFSTAQSRNLCITAMAGPSV